MKPGEQGQITPGNFWILRKKADNAVSIRLQHMDKILRQFHLEYKRKNGLCWLNNAEIAPSTKDRLIIKSGL
jgi:hypothetical protein